MSAHAEPEHARGHQHGHAAASAHHGSFRDYLIGFVLAAVLTAIPFWVVIDNVFRQASVAAVVILIFAFVQIIVHMVYFLHLNSRSEGGWTLMALIFTGVLVFITLTGSLWVIQHLNSNMMPMSPSQMRNMP